MLRIGAKINKSLSVTERQGAPFNPFPARQSPYLSARDIHSPQMPAVDVVTIRVEQNRLLVRRERPLLHFTNFQALTTLGRHRRQTAHTNAASRLLLKRS